MTIREAIFEQIKSMKGRSWREKVSYFWEYYGTGTVVLLLALVIVVAFVVNLATQKASAFTAVFFGAAPQDAADAYLSGYMQAAGIDERRMKVSVLDYGNPNLDAGITQETYQSIEVFIAMVSARSVDCFAANNDFFLAYAYQGYTADLRTVLEPEELEALAPHLLYIDKALLDAEDTDDTGTPQRPDWPDAADPEGMEDPIPVGVDLTGATAAFAESYPFVCADPVLGVCINSNQTANAAAFLRYCFDLS